VLTFADKLGRFFARQHGLPPVLGRVFAWLLICDPPEQTAAEIAEALHTSRSAVEARSSRSRTRDSSSARALRASVYGTSLPLSDGCGRLDLRQ
jgi:hypothetical protein